MADFLLLTTFAFFFSILLCHADGYLNFGVLHAQQSSNENHYGQYCIMFNPQFRELPSTKDDSAKLPLVDVTETSHGFMCEEMDTPPEIKGAAVALKRGNCTFSEKAKLVQKYGGSAAIVVSNTGLTEPGINSSADIGEINISVAVLSSADLKLIQALGEAIEVQLYAPPVSHMDFTMLVMFVLAVGTITIGAYQSGNLKHKRSLALIELDRQGEGGKDPEAFDMSPKFILLLVILMCAMLVSLYFFYDYLVFVIIGLFALASSTALFLTLQPYIECIPYGNCRIPPNNLPVFKGQPEVRSIFLCLICIGIGAFWAVQRNESYAWIIQDILGFVFCVNTMKMVRLPTLKPCAILLSLLFFYDIFFVFITPLFTKSGQSVMVEVATGGESKSGEMLPMVFKVPHVATSYHSVCTLPYSLLGFGDILVPGLLISFCHGFDLKVHSHKLYFIANVIAYSIGLALTFVALTLMEQGQPALLYLVPCTLLTTFMIGCIRGELRHLWTGNPVESKERTDDVPAEVAATPNSVETISVAKNEQRNNGHSYSDDSSSETEQRSPLIIT